MHSTNTIAELTSSRYIRRLYYAGSSGTELKQCPLCIRAIIHVSKYLSSLARPVSTSATARHADDKF